MTSFAVEFGRAKAVAAFLVTELGAVAIFVADNARVAGYIALGTAILSALAVYQIPNTVKAAVVVPDPPVTP